jgi:hypothetical protein
VFAPDLFQQRLDLCRLGPDQKKLASHSAQLGTPFSETIMLQQNV